MFVEVMAAEHRLSRLSLDPGDGNVFLAKAAIALWCLGNAMGAYRITRRADGVEGHLTASRGWAGCFPG